MVYVIPISMLVFLFQKNVIVNAAHGDDDDDDLCAPGCYSSWPGDDICDSACYNEACNWDEGDCTYYDDCAPGCYDSWPGDSICDIECYNKECNWDEGDCNYDDDDIDIDISTACFGLCDLSELGDGTCNYWCSGSDCNYDGGDCVEQCDNANECVLDNLGVGKCGFYTKNTDKWCEFDGAVVCCSENNDFSDCCESDPVKISITVVGGFLLCIAPCIIFGWAWRKKRKAVIVPIIEKVLTSVDNGCILQLHLDGKSYKDIARQFKVSRYVIHGIIKKYGDIENTIDHNNDIIEMIDATANTIATTNDDKYAIV